MIWIVAALYLMVSFVYGVFVYLADRKEIDDMREVYSNVPSWGHTLINATALVVSSLLWPTDVVYFCAEGVMALIENFRGRL